MALIEVRHLKKYFNTAGGVLHAVDDVTLDIERSRTLGVVGESGCGKSTLGRTIIRLLEPTSGEVHFNGTNITQLNNRDFKKLRVGMQMIFQAVSYTHLDVYKRQAQGLPHTFRAFTD